MAEKRRHVRASLQTEVWLGQDGIFTHTSETLRDLSESGAFIEASQGLLWIASSICVSGCPIQSSSYPVRSLSGIPVKTAVLASSFSTFRPMIASKSDPSQMRSRFRQNLP